MAELRWAGIAGLVVLLGGGAAFSSAEGLGTWDGRWWAFTTATTVGYGDVSPSTVAGRVIAIVVIAVGLGIVAFLTGAIAEWFVRSDVQHAFAEMEADGAVILG